MTRWRRTGSIPVACTTMVKVKRCGKCGTVSDNFAIRKRNKDGLQNWCRLCNSVYSRSRYQRIRPRRLEQNRNWLLATKAKLLAFKQTQSCMDCGNTDWRVFEFDHTEDNKVGNVSDLLKSWSWDRLKTEIEKCDLVCANCHRIRTWSRNQQGVGACSKQDEG